MLEAFEQREVDTGEVTINLVTGGKGPPLLMLHGYPETHAMWHRIAPALAEHFTLVMPDLRGYGDSAKPEGDKEHLAYSKRVMAADQVTVMEKLGYPRFQVAGHDRGARVTHRMCLDHPGRIERAAILDIVPTATVYGRLSKRLASAYFHWFYLIQPQPLPEKMIGHDPDFWLDRLFASWKDKDVFTPEAMAEYKRFFRDPAAIHATCEDYRAGASIDLQHDKEDGEKRIECPLLVLWGKNGIVGGLYDPVEEWRLKANDVRGHGVPGGHFLPEEAPDETLAAFLDFFRR